MAGIVSAMRMIVNHIGESVSPAYLNENDLHLIPA